METTTMATTDDSRLLRIEDVARLTGLSSRCVRNYVDAGRMPKPVRVGAKSVRWRADDLRRWIAEGCPAAATVEVGRG